MKRVLLVYPDSDSPHALRIIRPLARHLPDLGWRPVLLTQEGQGGSLELERIEVAARHVAISSAAVGAHQAGRAAHVLRRARSALARQLILPDRYIWWALQATRAAQRLHGFAGVISAGPPHSAHLVARSFARRFNVPWVADLRDAWSTNHYTLYSFLNRRLDRQIERFTLRGATAVTTVSDAIASDIESVLGRQVEVVSNCYDEDEMSGFGDAAFEPLVVSYTGSLIGGRRNPEPFMQALAILSSQHPELHVRAIFATDDADAVGAAARRAGVERLVETLQWQDRAGVLELWRRSSVLLLLRWDDPGDAGVPTGKLFEYLGARRPVLSMGGPPGIVDEILRETGAGIHATEPADAACFLWTLSERGHQLTADVGRFGSSAMAASFARLLER